MDNRKPRRGNCAKLRSNGNRHIPEPGFIYPSYSLYGMSHVPEPAKDLMEQSLQPASYVDRFGDVPLVRKLLPSYYYNDELTDTSSPPLTTKEDTAQWKKKSRRKEESVPNPMEKYSFAYSTNNMSVMEMHLKPLDITPNATKHKRKK